MAGATTLTGSIGVIAGKIDWHGLLEKASIHREIIRIGATASMPSTFTSYSDQEWELYDAGWMKFISASRHGSRSAEGVARGHRGDRPRARLDRSPGLEPWSHRRDRRCCSGGAESQRAGADSTACRCPHHDHASDQSGAVAVCGAGRVGASAEESAATVDRACPGVDATRDACLLISHSRAAVPPSADGF